MKIKLSKRCETCANYLHEYAQAGLCQKLGVVCRRGEYILDGIDVLERLGFEKVEYRRPITRKDFSCYYWRKCD